MTVPRSLQASMAALNAAMYAVLGYMTFLGVFAPIVGVVRFWGIAVVVPAVFAFLFGGPVGGVGAALGIFISDMVIHGNALLSLTVGVPANFVMFYIIGSLGKAGKRSAAMNVGLASGCLVIAVIFLTRWLMGAEFTMEAAGILLSFALASIVLAIALVRLWAEWGGFALASIVGNAVGSGIVGLGVWAFSQFFVLPLNYGHQLPFTAAMIWFAWTFTNQMPFLLAFGPPILKACYRAFPSLVQKRP
ncbi:MAG: hypothetical protein QXK96_03605 [Candidatus Bathyarchaeia archaeon]